MFPRAANGPKVDVIPRVKFFGEREPAMPTNQSFLFGGELSYQDAMHEQIHAAVEAEYATRFVDCTFWQFLKLNYDMKREIHRRLNEVVSPTSLYGRK